MGLNPVTPQNAAGMRIEPPVSVPSAPSASLAATAAPEPPEEPPGTCVSFHGLCVAPKCTLLVVPPRASSCVFALPMITAPASRSRRTAVASSVGTRSKCALVPPAVTTPAVSKRSFTAIGMPSIGP